MDKVEYKIRADEIKALVGEGRFAEAVRIADTIDWKKVRSVQMLCMISDLYKINRRYEESRDVLLMAYDRHPTGRAIVYSLCELAIKMGEFVQAVEYYKEFVRIAPRDTGRYILQYKLYEAQDVSLEERIAVLEEYKKHDYKEKWVYELAYLYHRVGLTTECIETCDEMFLWLGDGNYVMKALELKALHEPLSKEQQDRYVRYKQAHGGYVDKSVVIDKALDQVGNDDPRTVEIKQPTKEMPPVTDADIAAYNASAHEDSFAEQSQPAEETYTSDISSDSPTREMDRIVYPHISEIKEPSVDVSAYNTMNLQEALAENLKAVMNDSDPDQELNYTPVTDQETSPVSPVQPITSEIFEVEKESDMGMQEIFAQATAEKDLEEQEDSAIPEEPSMNIEIKYGGNGPILGEEKVSHTPVYDEKPLEDEVPGAVIHPNAAYQAPSHFDSFLSQEYDGQISMAVEPEPEVEKQITGQISIDEYMLNWESYKKSQQEKQLERVKKLVAEETGDLFADFDEKTKVGLQEKMEKAIADALKRERHEKASGRGDWSKNKEDIIDNAVDDVIKSEELDEASDTKEEVFLDETAELEKIVEEDLLEAKEDQKPEEKNAKEPEKEDSKKLDDGEVEDVEEPKEEEKETSNKSSEEEDEEEDEALVEEKDTEGKEDSDKDEEDQDDEEEEKSPEKSKESEEPKEPQKNKKADKKKDKKNKKAENDAAKRHIGNREIEERVRTMTPEEKQLFGPYIHHKKSRRQIINAIDNMSMDAFSGNAIVTGEEGAGTVNLAKGLIKAVQASDSNFSGKVAKITANTLNKKSVESIFDKLANGALIIQRAADLEPETVNELLKVLQEENKGLIIVMEDTKEDMNRFLDKNPSLKQSFNVRVDIEALDDDSLVAYAKQYALEKEYSIDNLGILALHTRISERQTLDHEVTVSEVKDIIDDAIYYAEKRSISHFVDVIVNKRYDENDMVILREKDFMH